MLAETKALATRGSRVAPAVFVSQADVDIHERTVLDLACEVVVFEAIVLYLQGQLGASLARDQRCHGNRALALPDDSPLGHAQRVHGAEADARNVDALGN